MCVCTALVSSSVYCVELINDNASKTAKLNILTVSDSESAVDLTATLYSVEYNGSVRPPDQCSRSEEKRVQCFRKLQVFNSTISR